MTDDLLSQFHPAVNAWFSERFTQPTPPQRLGWPLISAGKNTLILAPTGSGKTLTAFLAGINTVLNDLLESGKDTDPGVRILYISPLKALNYDIDRNLKGPLSGIIKSGEALGMHLPEIRTAVRTGDTPASERRKMLKKPPHILITTPESLHIMLTSSARDILTNVQYVIVDEIHSMCSNKRGVFLSILLERLENICTKPPVRVGLSATQKPLSEVAAFLGGYDAGGNLRPVEIVDTGIRKEMDLKVISPVDDYRHPGEGSVWPSVYSHLLKLVKAHHSTIIFANTRRMVERITSAVNELAGEEIVLPHHGSVASEVRRSTEEKLKNGEVKGVVATGTLELGIDMGAVDLVCQIESPKEVSRGLQRVGRAGHIHLAVSKGRIIPKTMLDLAESAAVAIGMQEGDVEPLTVPRNCLDVLAQQIVAMAALEPVESDFIYRTMRRAYSYGELTEETYNLTLQLVSGRYPSKAFRDLRARVSLDRVSGKVSPLPGSQRLVISNGGVIPDTGEYGVYLGDSKLKLGELDEEFVFEAREGDVFSLGTNTWRISEIRDDRVIVSHSSSIQAGIPFWRGEAVPRGAHVGRIMGKLLREIAESGDNAEEYIINNTPLDKSSAENLARFVNIQSGLSKDALPTDRRIVLESFLDDIGEYRLALLSTYGGRVHQALRIAFTALMKQEVGIVPESIVGDNGILFRLPGADQPPPVHLLKKLTPDLAYQLILEELPNSALFGLRFRQNAARALLLPGAGPGKRTPLWLQRLKSKDLLYVAKSYDGFPIVIETYRECLMDHLDIPSVRELLEDIQMGKIEVASSQRQIPSQFVSTLLLDFQMINQYEWDEPKSDSKKRKTSIERRLVSELVDGKIEKELDENAISGLESQIKRTDSRFKCRTAEELYELFRRCGDLTQEEAQQSTNDPSQIDSLLEEGEIVLLDTPSAISPQLLIASDHLERYLDAYNNSSYTSQDSKAEIIENVFYSSAAISAEEIAQRYGFDISEVLTVINRMTLNGEIISVLPKPGTKDLRYTLPVNLEIIYRRSLALQKSESKPVTHAEYSSFLLDWQHRRSSSRAFGMDGLKKIIRQLEGIKLPFNIWEPEVLARRVDGFNAEYLDTLCSIAEIIWQGISQTKGKTGNLALYTREDFAFLPDDTSTIDIEDKSEEYKLIKSVLEEKGALFAIDIAISTSLDSRIVQRKLWEMAWRGEVTHDYFKTLRSGQPPKISKPAESIKREAYNRQKYYSVRSKIAKTFSTSHQSSPGRWMLTSKLRYEKASDREQLELIAMLLLERYGIIGKDLVNRPGEVEVSWGQLYNIYQKMELAGEIERGYYIEGLSGGQFGLPEACDILLKRKRIGIIEPPIESDILIINAMDPAFLFSSSGVFELPDFRIPRLISNYVIMLNGMPAILLELSAKRLTSITDIDEDTLVLCLAEIKSLFNMPYPIRPFRKIEIEYWAENSILSTPAEAILLELGFIKLFKTLELDMV